MMSQPNINSLPSANDASRVVRVMPDMMSGFSIVVVAVVAVCTEKRSFLPSNDETTTIKDDHGLENGAPGAGVVLIRCIQSHPVDNGVVA